MPGPVENTAPSIAGAAISSVEAGSVYSFTPTASDADGDELTFQIQNKPDWATFSTVTGKLSGAPMQAHAGAYANIAIGVSDGAASVFLPSFSITVTQSMPHTATLSWVAPTENVDGSALVNLAGFTIVYGPSPAMLHQSVRIDNPSVSTYVLDDLPSGAYYFGVKAYTASGAESTLSNVASKVIE